VDRRTFLRLGLGGAGAAAFLAACGRSAGPVASPSTSTSPAPVGGDLNLFVWQGYAAPDHMDRWLAREGITEHVRYISQPDDVPAVLGAPGGDRWDMSYGDNVVLTHYRDLGLVAPIAPAEVPGLAGLLPAFQAPPWKNEDGTYNGVPWTWGYWGLTYRPNDAPTPTSWHDLLDPAVKGRVSTVDGALNNVELACIAIGIDPDTLTTEQLNGPVRAWLTKLVAQVETLAASIEEQIALLVSGRVVYMAVGLNSMDRATAAKGVRTRTIVPTEGAMGWADTTFVTPSAPHPQNALAFAERLLDPATNADANSELLQGAGVAAAIPSLSPAAKALYPYDDIDRFLSDALTFGQGFPYASEGGRATYDQVVQVWSDVTRS